MDTSGYENFTFRDTRAFNLAGSSEDRSFPAHRHAYGEIIVVGRGKTNFYRIDDTFYSLREGDIILVWPMEQHEIINADREYATVIQYSNAFADSIFDVKRIINMYHDLHIICINTHPGLGGKLISKIDNMRLVLTDSKPNNDLRCAILLSEFMLILDEYQDELMGDISNDGGKSISETTLSRIISVMDYIRNNLTAEDLSLGAMAERAGLNKDYFSRAFKEATGQNYIKWLNTVRVEKAVSLLPEKALSLTEIAMLSGFKSIPSFNRVFLEYKQVPPSKFRK
ncbi:AraC-like ligand binding domain-containing protein [Ruminococcaceae bacterium YRB3002]|nr:AraC-like ligand binding domain-containing protein [Ruminococcaceae bacterium YRB3002]